MHFVSIYKSYKNLLLGKSYSLNPCFVCWVQPTNQLTSIKLYLLGSRMFRTISTDEYQPASEESKEEAAEKAKKQWQDRHMTVTPYGYNSIVENNYSAPSQK